MKKKRNNLFFPPFWRRGQMTVEMVLLLALMISMSYLVLNEFKTIRPIYNFISGPWKTIGGMIESGSWQKIGDARRDHPNHWKRMYTPKGIDPN